MNEAIEDGVGVGRIADDIVPAFHGKLRLLISASLFPVLHAAPGTGHLFIFFAAENVAKEQTHDLQPI